MKFLGFLYFGGTWVVLIEPSDSGKSCSCAVKAGDDDGEITLNQLP